MRFRRSSTLATSMLTAGLLLAACGDDDAPAGAPTADDDAAQDAAEADPPEGDGSAAEDPAAAPGDGWVADTPLSDFGLSPEDGWSDDHFDVEVPDEAGTAVLVIDGERFELSGSCSGRGPTGMDDDGFESEFLDEQGDFNQAAAMQIRYFVFDAGFWPVGGDDWELELSRTVAENQTEGPHIGERDLLRLHSEGRYTAYRYVGFVDGSTEQPVEFLEGNNWTDEPFLRIDRDGVFTAVGTVEQTRIPEGSDGHLLGAFELGGRCDDGWDPA